MPNYRRVWHAGGTYFFTVRASVLMRIGVVLGFAALYPTYEPVRRIREAIRHLENKLFRDLAELYFWLCATPK